MSRNLEKSLQPISVLPNLTIIFLTEKTCVQMAFAFVAFCVGDPLPCLAFLPHAMSPPMADGCICSNPVRSLFFPSFFGSNAEI